MRIAIFTNNYLPNPYGVSMSIESFRKEFEKLGHTVYVFAPEFKGYIDENVNVFRYPSLNLTFKKINFPIAIPYSHCIDRILEKLEIDVIHAQHPNLLGWTAQRWVKKKNVPLVFTWHTLYDQYSHFAPFFVPKKFAAWWSISNAVRFANGADFVVVPTPSVAKIIKNWGVKNGNVIAIPTGVESSSFDGADRNIIRKEFAIKDDEIVLLLLSRLTAEKNVEFLVKAVAEVLKKNSKVKFILAGGGSELTKLKNILEKAGVAGRVIFQGIVDREKAKNIYASADIFVYASKSETQGMVISEALYSGLPVVAIKATGIKDLVTNQVSGLLVEENQESFIEAVGRLIEDGDLRKKFSENARRIASEQYTSIICAQKMFGIYEDAIQKKNRERKI